MSTQVNKKLKEKLSKKELTANRPKVVSNHQIDQRWGYKSKEKAEKKKKLKNKNRNCGYLK